MHDKFADWYRPVTFGNNRETLELRWKSVEGFLSQVQVNDILELVRVVFGKKCLSEETINKFRVQLKSDDPSFLTTGNEREILVLAGCALAVICTGDSNYEAPLAILTASACNTRKILVDIDLLAIAAHRQRVAGVQARQRALPDFSAIDKSVFVSGFQQIEKLQDVPNSLAGFKSLAETCTGIIIEFAEAIESLNTTLKIQDEELQILWWMMGQRSQMWDRDFNELPADACPILLAIEAATLSEEFTEAPSQKAIFSRIGMNSGAQVGIPAAVNSCGNDSIKRMVPSGLVCPTVFPVHFALSRALETGVGQDWIRGWSKATGIAEDIKVSPLELSLQTHRELKLLNMISQ